MPYTVVIRPIDIHGEFKKSSKGNKYVFSGVINRSPCVGKIRFSWEFRVPEKLPLYGDFCTGMLGTAQMTR